MGAASRCRECGAVIPAGLPAGLCGRCLFALGLEQRKGQSPKSEVRSPRCEGGSPECGGEGQADRDEGASPRSPKSEVRSLKSEVQDQVEADKAVLVTAPVVERAGDRIGRYRLLEEIGEGGFGVVYRAEQLEPVRREVALKVIKAGMDTREVIARFEAERQALALMDHPGIAKVLDAGATQAGRPYFVMELVPGLPITRYCDQNHLAPAQRLELFVQVCRAVQHAHQKGIIHRDLKPSNILVSVRDGVPVPRIIDFGIAKATQGELTDKTVHTQLQRFLGTPAYMSPEQAGLSGLDVDTRSDIYALGVLLYELLVGKTPFEAKELLEAGVEEMRQTIREREPTRPSTRLGSLEGKELATAAQCRGTEARKLISLLRGDLDWIVMKCLEKDRTRRYETATGLARDVGRFLSHEPVSAVAPSLFYRTRKFARRHRPALAASSALLLLLIAGTVVSTWQALRAKRAERAQGLLRVQAEQGRGKEAELRQQAQAALYQGRLSENRALRQARPPGWSALAMANLSSNALANLPGQDLVELRSEAVACFQGLDAVETARLPKGVLAIWSLDFSPEGAVVASADMSGSSRLWSLVDGRLFWERQDPAVIGGTVDPGHNGAASPAIRFHPGGDLLAYGTWSRSVEVVTTGQPPQPVFRVPSGSQPVDIAFDGKGAVMAVAWADGGVIAYDAMTGKVLRQVRQAKSGRAPHREAVALSPDGTALAATGDGYTIELHDLTREDPGVVLGQHRGEVRSLAFSPDGNQLASASHDRTAKMFDVKAGKELFALVGHQAWVYAAVFRPDGRVVATVSEDQTARFWDARTGEPLLVLRPQVGPLLSAAFSPDGQSLAVAFTGIILYQLTNDGAKQVLYGHTHSVGSLAFHPAKPMLASASGDESIILWDLLSGQAIERLLWQSDAPPRGVALTPGPSSQSSVLTELTNARPNGLAFTPDGRWLVAGQDAFVNSRPKDHRLRLWETLTGKPFRTIGGHQTNAACVAVDSAGKLLVSGDEMGTVIVTELAALERQTRWQRDGDAVIGLQFVRPELTLLAAYRSGHLELRDPLTCAILAETHVPETLKTLAVSPRCDQLAVATEAGAIHPMALPDFTRTALLGQSLGKGDSTFTDSAHVAYSADGRVLAAGGTDCRVSLWDASRGRKLLEFPRQEGPVSGVAFDPNGSRLAICSREHQVTVWDLRLVRDRLRGLGLDWDPPAGPYGHLEENPDWRMKLAESYLSQTNWPRTNVLAMVRLARVLAQNPGTNAAAPAMAHRLSVRAIEAAPHQPEVWLLRAELLENAGDVAGALAVFDRAAEQNPQDPVFWTAQAKLLEKQNWLDEAVQALTKSIDLAGNQTNSPGGTATEALLSRARLSLRLGRLKEAGRDNCRAREIPPHDPLAGPNLVDLSPFYNVALTENVMDVVGNVCSVPAGLLELGDVQFDVRGLVHVSSREVEKWLGQRYPVSVTGIPLNRKFLRLHCLQGTQHPETDGNTIGRYVIHYADGQQVDVPVVYGRDVRDWWRPLSEESPESLESKVAWGGGSPLARSKGCSLRLYELTWENPRPQCEVQSLDLVTAMTASALFLIAVTTEDRSDPAAALSAYERAVANAPQEPGFWLTLGKQLARNSRPGEALLAVNKSVELAAGRGDTNGETLTGALLGRASVLSRLGRLEQAARDNCQARKIPPRDPLAGQNLVDLGPFYNASFAEELVGTPGNVCPLPTGLLKLGGVQFDVRGLIHLSGIDLESFLGGRRYPTSVAGIAVKSRFTRLHCLGGGGWSESDGKTVGHCLLHYANGQQAELPIVYGRDMRDWWRYRAEEPADPSPSQVVWTGENPGGRRLQGSLRLYKWTWENPHPDLDAQSLDFVSSMTRCAPFLVAITVE